MIQEETLPHLWDENQKSLNWDSVEEGWLLKADIEINGIVDPHLFGYFRGIKKRPGSNITDFCLEVPDRMGRAETNGYCYGKVQEFSLTSIKHVKIVARDWYPANIIFQSIGKLRLELAWERDKNKFAAKVLEGRVSSYIVREK